MTFLRLRAEAVRDLNPAILLRTLTGAEAGAPSKGQDKIRGGSDIPVKMFKYVPDYGQNSVVRSKSSTQPLPPMATVLAIPVPQENGKCRSRESSDKPACWFETMFFDV